MKYKLLALSTSVLVTLTVIAGSTEAFTNRSSPSASAEATPVLKSGVKTVAELTFTNGEFDGTEVKKSEAQWKRMLTSDEYYVLRQEGTERAYTGALTNNKKPGTYYCAACGLALFSSDAKYDSETGWPSFFQPIFKKNVTEKTDKSLSEERTEVECARCHSHLGHVFNDGPQPTGLRYCMNSISLKFKASK